MKQQVKQILCFLTITALILTISYSGIVLPVEKIHASSLVAQAPLNPDFVDYMQDKQSVWNIFRITDSAGDGDYIPSPVMISQETDNTMPNLLSAYPDPLPSSFNTVKTTDQTPVKDQGESGACWAFSSLAALESFLLTQGESASDYSERNLMNTHGYDFDYLDGGNREIAMAYLARWDGPVFETDDLPFNPPSGSTNGSMPQNTRKHVQNTIYIESGDFTAIKRAIREYGAIYSDLYFDPYSNYYNAATAAYNCTTEHYSNHAITVVGWDDNYDKTNFQLQPKNNGAFIIKNSWGTDFGANGYFYISYEDMNFGQENYAFTQVDNVDNYDHIYQYDSLGLVSNYSFSSDATNWFANIFTASTGNETLDAVSFYTLSPAVSYEIYAAQATADGTPPDFSSTAPVVSGVIADAGYHTIDLPQSVALIPANKFAVAVKITDNTNVYPVACESAMKGYASNAEAQPGQSFAGYANGSDWEDMTQFDATLNVCLKAFTEETSSAIVTFDPQGGTVSPACKTVTVSSAYGTLPVPARPGYTFGGWYTGTNGTGSKITSTSVFSSVGNLTLYAKWTINTYTVSFNSNGGSVVTSKIVNYNSAVSVPANPTKSGYVFVGWYTSSSCTTPWNFATKITASRTLYAKWFKSTLSGLSAKSASYNSIKLAWTAVPGAAGYQIYGAPAGGQYVYLGTTTAAGFAVIKLANGSNLTAGTRYYFKVRAYTFYGTTPKYGSFSAAASAVPVPATSTSFAVARASSSSIKASWSSISGASGYEIYRATSAGGTYSKIKTLTGTSFTNTGLTTGKYYFYKVRAYRLVGTTKVYGVFTAVKYAKPY